MYVIKSNGRLVRDDRGCVYKYSSRAVAESKARMMFGDLFQKKYKVSWVQNH